MSRRGTAHAARVLWIGAGAVVFLAMALPVHLRPFNGMPDDAYFYLEIASNICEGQGSTFNRIMPTNGYHPLWMLFCVGAFGLAGGDKLLAVHLVIGLAQALSLATIVLGYRLTTRLGLKYGSIVVPVLSTYFLTGMLGSEAHLNGFLVVLVLGLFLRASREQRRPRLWAGVMGAVAGAAVLARLDNVFLMGVLVGGLGWLSLRERRGWRDPAGALGVWLAAGVAAVLVVGPYLALNLWTYGRVMPISGAIKSTFPSLSWEFASLGLLGQLTAAGGLALLAVAASPWRPARAAPAAALLGLGVLLHAFYVVAFTREVTQWSWYYVSGVIALALLSCVALNVLCSAVSRPALRRAVLVLAVLGASGAQAFGVARAWIKSSNPDAIALGNPFVIHAKVADEPWPRQVARWLRDNLPPGSGIFVWDLPGAVAFFTDHRILAADGLTCDYAYGERVMDAGISEYLTSCDVRYWLGPFARTRSRAWRSGRLVVARAEGGQTVEVFPPLDDRSAGVILLRDGGLVQSLRDVISHPAMPHIGLWQLPAEPPTPAQSGP